MALSPNWLAVEGVIIMWQWIDVNPPPPQNPRTYLGKLKNFAFDSVSWSHRPLLFSRESLFFNIKMIDIIRCQWYVVGLCVVSIPLGRGISSSSGFYTPTSSHQSPQ